MTPKGLRERLATRGLGLVLALALGLAAPGVHAAPAAARRPSSKTPTIYHKSRSFRIPFNVEPSERARLKEVQLWVSEDSGFKWEARSKTTPDRPYFTFRAPRDAEYWFAVRTLDAKGRLYPSDDEDVVPSMKVVVDTIPPSLILESEGRRGSQASVRWELKDAYLDLSSFALEYQAEGARDWRQVTIQHPALIGSQSWEAGTAEPLRVRATVADRAGNTTEMTVVLPEGTPGNPGVASSGSGDFSPPPPISRISSGPSFPPVEDLPPAPAASEAFPSEPGGRILSSHDQDPFGGAGASSPGATPAPAAVGGKQTLLVASPRFGLQYAVDDAGPNGPATVELWVTQDGGRTWIRRGEDPDRTSPFDVDLGGEGTFGLCLVARAASGLGDRPPAPGDPPQMWVEVDSTPPNVQLSPPVVGTGANLGKVAIFWRATDLHLGPAPVQISWKPDGATGARWTPIGEPIENTGKFVWTVPPNLPPRFHLRVDVVDALGNRGSAETTDMGPVIVDRTRPRSRIIGLDQSLRTGPGARPLR